MGASDSSVVDAARPAPRAVLPIAAATAIAGVCGYAITWFVPRVLGFREYAEFAVFWGLLFFLVAVLSGIQQEVTRAARPRREERMGRGNSDPLAAAAVGAGGALLVTGGTAMLWGPRVFPASPWLAVPVVVGLTTYVFVAVGYGILYGGAHWRVLVSLMTVEALARLVAVVSAVGLGGGVLAAAWATALGYSVALLVLAVPLLRIRRSVVIDIGYIPLLVNTGSTIAASASLGLMVSGLPFLMGLADPSRSALLGSLIVIVTFTRAPIVVVLMAFQSLLLVTFRARRESASRLLASIVLGIVVVAIVLAAVALLLGEPAFQLLFGEPAGIPVAIFPGMVASSALVGIVTVMGAALLARDRHRAYATAWVAGAVATIASFLLPLDIVSTTLIATLGGPTVAILVQAASLLRRHSAS